MHNEEILGNEGCFHDYLFSPVLESLQAMIQDIFPELEGPERRPIENGVGNACIFRSPSGNVEIRAGLWDNGNVKLGLRVFPEGDYPKLSSLSKLKGEVDRHWELTPESSEGRACWRALLKLRAEEMGGIREMLLREDLKRLKEWIKEQCPNPSYVDDPVFDAVAESKKYERFEGALQLVPPWGYPAQRND